MTMRALLALRTAFVFAAAIIVMSHPVFAASWSVEEGSRLGFKTSQGGAPVEGLFEDFEAEIEFSAEDLETSRVAIVIDVASVNSESKDRDDTIRSPSLFDVATWPTARFESKSFRRIGDDHFEAVADLTMRDVTEEVVLPFTLEIVPHPETEGHLRAIARGELAVMRLDYGIGQGMWQDTSVVPDEVVIFIDIVASRPAD
jgi:polyisoprenoid-binding protein YceI